MKGFVSFGKYQQSIYFMSTRFSKEKTNRVRVPQFQLACICDTNHRSHKHLVKLCCEVHDLW